MSGSGHRPSPTGRRELILYATPSGPLADQCDAYFDRLTSRLGATTAQTYPPHITLTGFFRRSAVQADEVIEEMAAQILTAGPVPPDAVKVVDLSADADWVGLSIDSAWLTELTATIVEHHVLAVGDDALRPKDWLHVSLAYGDLGSQPSLEAHSALARELIDPAAPVTWEVAIWERIAPDMDSRPALWQRH